MTASDLRHLAAATSTALDPTLLLAIVGALLAVISAIWQYRADLRAEVGLIASLTDRWQSLTGSWRRALLVARGPWSYYAPAHPSEIQEYRNLLVGLCPAPSEHEEFLRLTHESSKWEQDAQEVIAFLASLSLLILTGKIRPSAAYAVCGLDICRNGGSIRALVETDYRGVTEVPPPRSTTMFSDDPTTDPADNAPAVDVLRSVRSWAHYREGLTRRLLIALDIFWAEAARLGDLDPWQLMQAADVKQNWGTGTRNRKRLLAEIRRVGAAPFWVWRAARLVGQLRWSEWRRGGHRSGLPRDLREEAEKWISNMPR